VSWSAGATGEQQSAEQADATHAFDPPWPRVSGRIADPTLSTPWTMADIPAHHTADGFRNPPGAHPRGGTAEDWKAFRRRVLLSRNQPDVPDGFVLPRALAKHELARQHGDSLTWLGHAAFLVRLGGMTVLTDPHLSDYASPFQALRLGPKRFTPPGIAVKDLPPIDVVVVSHNHYDHLDAATLRRLPHKDRISVVVPLGLGDFCRKRGFADVRELDWEMATARDGLTVTCLPAYHWSGRWLNDRNQTLWCGFAIEHGGRRVYFAGDTGYGPAFAALGRRYGPFDTGLVPIGAYAPRLLMAPQHVDPDEAVKIGRDLGCRRLVGMHWGSIVLTTEPAFEPPERFRAAGRAGGYRDEDLWVMRIGETRALAPATVPELTLTGN
jgi:L-ascorbate metabolism protein UlaG (beta-lactamase superfamily)